MVHRWVPFLVLVAGCPGSRGPSNIGPSDIGPLAPIAARDAKDLPAGAVLQFGSTRLLADGIPSRVATDGDRAATASYDDVIAIWDLPSGRITHRVPRPGMIKAIALRGAQLFVLGRDRGQDIISRIAWKTGTEEHRITLSEDPWRDSEPELAVDRAGTKLALSRGMIVVVRDAQGDMQQLWQRSFPTTSLHTGLGELAIDERGTIVHTDEILLVDHAGKDVMTIKGGPWAVATAHGIAYSAGDEIRLVPYGSKKSVVLPAPSGQLAAAGDGMLWVHADDRMYRIDVQQRRRVGSFPSHGVHGYLEPTRTGVLSYQRNRLALFGPDGWSPEHGANITSMSLSADGRRLATSDDGGRVILWNARTGAATGSLDAHVEGFIGDNESVSLLREPYVLTLTKDTMRLGSAVLHDLASGKHTTISKNVFHAYARVASAGTHFMILDQVDQGGVSGGAWHGYALGQLGAPVRDLGRLTKAFDLREPCHVSDQRVLLTSNTGGKQSVLRSDGGRDTVLFERNDARGITCFPDGRHFLVWPALESAPARIVDATGTTVGELTVDAADLWMVPDHAFTEDGKHIAVLTRSRRVLHWTFVDGQITAHPPLGLDADPVKPKGIGDIALAPDGTYVYHQRARDVVVYKLP